MGGSTVLSEQTNVLDNSNHNYSIKPPLQVLVPPNKLAATDVDYCMVAGEPTFAPTEAEL